MKIFGIDLSIKHVCFLTPDGKEHAIFFRQSWCKGIYEIVHFDGETEDMKIVDAYPSARGGIGQAAEMILWFLWSRVRRWFHRRGGL